MQSDRIDLDLIRFESNLIQLQNTCLIGFRAKILFDPNKISSNRINLDQPDFDPMPSPTLRPKPPSVRAFHIFIGS